MWVKYEDEQGEEQLYIPTFTDYLIVWLIGGSPMWFYLLFAYTSAP